ncbi:MAG: MBL fold metallo-hydrolase [Paenibacillaceae bacterium]
MNKRKIAVALLTIFMLLVVSCSNDSTESDGSMATVVEEASDQDTAQAQEVEEEAVEEVKEELPPIKLDTETLKNDSGKIMLRSMTNDKSGFYHATVAIVSPTGTVVFADPYMIPQDNGLIKADIVTVSHGHGDHMDIDYLQPYFDGLVEGTTSLIKAEQFTVKDVQVTGVAASHVAVLDLANPTDIIYVFEIDGVRIVHLADLGQEELTEDQLKQIGRVDILFSNFSNVTGYGFGTQKTINIVKQLKPTIVLPLHYQEDVIPEIQQALGIKDISEEETLLIDKDDLAEITELKYIFLK